LIFKKFIIICNKNKKRRLIRNKTV